MALLHTLRAERALVEYVEPSIDNGRRARSAPLAPLNGRQKEHGKTRPKRQERKRSLATVSPGSSLSSLTP